MFFFAKNTLYRHFLIQLFSIFIIVFIVKAADVTSDKTISTTVTAQQHIKTNSDITLSITNGGTISRSNYAIKVNATEAAAADDATISVSSGGTVETTSGGNAIYAQDVSGLTIDNSGTISSSESTKAIDVAGADDVTITNNSGGEIYAKGRVITLGNATNVTINNSGKIYGTTGGNNADTIYGANNTASITLNNNSGGEIKNNGTSKAAVRLIKDSTITNSGTIKNDKGPDYNAIKLTGNNNTVNLKDEGIIIGKIESAGSNNTLKLNHGVGKSYYYETTGNFTLEDLDGNNVVKGSAGSVGQGGSEILDELLGYRSLNIRKSLTRYNRSVKNNSDDEQGWGEINFSTFKRKQKNSSLSLGFNYANLGINLINPYKDSDFIFSFETGSQNFTKDHSINRYSIHSGLFFSDKKIFNAINSENFIVGGITLNDSVRKILTNTTSSGTLTLSDVYESYELIAGTKIKNKYFMPNIGMTFGLSHTPGHSEDYFFWRKKDVSNLSFYFDDDYELKLVGNTAISFGWLLDFRKLVSNRLQTYEVKGTEANYLQHVDLTEEITFSGALGIQKQFSENHSLKISLDGIQSTQELTSVSGNFSYKFIF